MGRILSIDYGGKRTGIAVSDPFKIIASGLCTVETPKLKAFLKEYFAQMGIVLNYPKEVIKEAYAVGIINDEDLWIHMLLDRNMTSHTYNKKLADEIYEHIKNYTPEFKRLLSIIDSVTL